MFETDWRIAGGKLLKGISIQERSLINLPMFNHRLIPEYESWMGQMSELVNGSSASSKFRVLEYRRRTDDFINTQAA